MLHRKQRIRSRVATDTRAAIVRIAGINYFGNVYARKRNDDLGMEVQGRVDHRRRRQYSRTANGEEWHMFAGPWRATKEIIGTTEYAYEKRREEERGRLITREIIIGAHAPRAVELTIVSSASAPVTAILRLHRCTRAAYADALPRRHDRLKRRPLPP